MLEEKAAGTHGQVSDWSEWKIFASMYKSSKGVIKVAVPFRSREGRCHMPGSRRIMKSRDP